MACSYPGSTVLRVLVQFATILSFIPWEIPWGSSTSGDWILYSKCHLWGHWRTSPFQLAFSLFVSTSTYCWHSTQNCCGTLTRMLFRLTPLWCFVAFRICVSWMAWPAVKHCCSLTSSASWCCASLLCTCPSVGRANHELFWASLWGFWCLPCSVYPNHFDILQDHACFPTTF